MRAGDRLFAWAFVFLGILDGVARAVRTWARREEELQRVSARFADWRRARRRGTPIPVELWELAVELNDR